MAEERSSTGAHGDLSPGSSQTPKPPVSTPKINTLPPPSADDSTTQGKSSDSSACCLGQRLLIVFP